MRIISIDTETTGLHFYNGHRIIEIGCIEIINNKITENNFHTYLNPERNIDIEAKKITGISDDFLKNKPFFKEIVDDFLTFIKNSDKIIIHNANFDINFINNELRLCDHKILNINNHFNIIDTLKIARRFHPGKKNNLNSLCERYSVNNSKRYVHGALIDAELLAKVYIEMSLKLSEKKKYTKLNNNFFLNNFKFLKASEQEITIHNSYINNIKRK